MRIFSNRRLLKTKIVATVGKERSGPQAGRNDEICRPNLSPVDNVLDQGDLLSWLVNAGADVIRLNMSFASSEGKDYGSVERRVLEWLTTEKDGLAKNVAVLGDLPGPKIRLRLLTTYDLATGAPFFLNFNSDSDFPADRPGAVVLINDRPFGETAKVNGSTIEDYVDQLIDKEQGAVFSIGDGKVYLTALRPASNGIVECKVTKGGRIKDRPGVTIKRADIEILSHSEKQGLDNLFEQDEKALDFLLNWGAEVVAYIGVSFVNCAEDILKVRRHIEKHFGAKHGTNARRYAPAIVAKIETRKAWVNLDEILDVSDCVMVARGDLGLQLDPQEVPAIQKKIIRRCNVRGKPVITATQMLDSMETNLEPTRAEANDVFNAIQDGTDAVMLSGETSNGKYPSQAVEMMVRIAEQAEKFYVERYSGRAYETHLQDIWEESEELAPKTTKRLQEAKTKYALMATESKPLSQLEEDYNWAARLYDEKIKRSKNQKTTDRISESACFLSEGDGYKAIVAPTTSGRTARMIARFRPQVPILGVAHDKANARKLVLSAGVYPLCIGDGHSTVEEVFDHSCAEAVKNGYLQKGDAVISTSGTPLFEVGTTNLIRIGKVE